MNKPEEKPAWVQALVERAIARPDLRKADGSLNVSALARFLGVNQPTLKRVIAGEIKKPNPKIVAAMVDKFKITRSEAFGDAILEAESLPGNATAIARRYLRAAPIVQEYIETVLASWETIEETSPFIAKIMHTDPVKARRIEPTLVSVDKTIRKKNGTKATAKKSEGT